MQPKLLQAKLSLSTGSFDSLARTQVASTDEGFTRLVEGSQFDRQQALEIENGPRRPKPEIEYAKAISAYGTYEVIATSGYRARLHHVVSGSSIDLSVRRITCAAFPPPGIVTPQLAVGCLDGSVWLFDCDSAIATERLGVFPGIVHSLDYSPDGEWLAVGGQGGTVRLIQLTDPQRVQVLTETFGPIRSVRFSLAGRKLAVVTDTTWRPVALGRVDIWNVVTARWELTISCPTAVGVAGFDSLGNVLTAEWSGVLRTWSPQGQLISIAQKPKDIISAAAFSPNTITLESLADFDSVLSE